MDATIKQRKPRRSAGARERIDHAAYELFSRYGVRAVGVDTIVARSGVAKKTLYQHYPSKEELALAFLRRREELWTRAWLQEGVQGRADTPAGRLLAIFDVFDTWFRRPDFEGCAFAKVLLEHGDPAHSLRKSAASHIGTLGGFIRQLAAEAGARDPDGLALQWQIVMAGSIIAAYAGERDAARRAKEIGVQLLTCEGIRSRSPAR